MVTEAKEPLNDLDQTFIYLNDSDQNKVIKKYFSGISEYWQSALETQRLKKIPDLYHGTRVSALFGIRHRGLVPHVEGTVGNSSVYGVINPESAVYHLLIGGTFDSYNAEKPKISKINQSDPPVILKIDIESYFQEIMVKRIPRLVRQVLASEREELNETLKSVKELQKNGLSKIDLIGVPICTTPIAPQHLRVLSVGFFAESKNVGEELTLEEACNIVLGILAEDS